jgi:hypothetical protein
MKSRQTFGDNASRRQRYCVIRRISLAEARAVTSEWHSGEERDVRLRKSTRNWTRS